MAYRSKIVSASHSLKNKRIAFYRSDITAIRAARFLRDNTDINPILIGSAFTLRDLSDKIRISLKNIEIINEKTIFDSVPSFSANINPVISQILAKFNKEEIAASPLLLPLGIAASGIADNYFIPFTIDLWKIIQTINPELDNMISGFHLLFSEEANKTMLFADTCINAQPQAETVAETAIRSANNFSAITGKKPKVALLSFSTKGSAKHELPAIMQNALKIIKQKTPSLIVDGEIQFDAAAVHEISEQKAPGNVLHGETNVFIFPNLNSARNGYQIARSIAGYLACGGFIQGFNLPLIFTDPTTNFMELVETAMISAFYRNL